MLSRLSIERKPLSKKKIHMHIARSAASSVIKTKPTLLLDSEKQPQFISRPLTMADMTPNVKTQRHKNKTRLLLFVLKPFSNNNPAKSSAHGSVMATRFVSLTGTIWSYSYV